jgi:hypothetical protein
MVPVLALYSPEIDLSYGRVVRKTINFDTCGARRMARVGHKISDADTHLYGPAEQIEAYLGPVGECLSTALDEDTLMFATEVAHQLQTAYHL